PTYYLAKFDITQTKGIDKIAKFYYLTDILKANVITANLGLFQADGISALSTALGGGIFETFEGVFIGLKNDFLSLNARRIGFINDVIDNFFTGQRPLEKAERTIVRNVQWASSSIVLNSCFADNPIITAAYNTWGLARQYGNVSAKFSNTVESELIEGWKASSGVARNVNIYKNNNKWIMLDGGSNGFAPIPQEYLVMADFIDYMVRFGVRAYVVSSQSPLIDWSVVNKNCYKSPYVTEDSSPTSSGLYELCVNYDNVGYVAYKPTMADSEEQGAIFLMCTYNSASGLYEPIVPNKKMVVDGVLIPAFTSSAYGYTNASSDNPEGLVIARGVFERNFGSFGTTGQGSNNNPTIIQQLVKDSSGNVISSSVPFYMNFNSGNFSTSVNYISSLQTYDVDLKSSSKIALTGISSDATTGAKSFSYSSINGEELQVEDFVELINQDSSYSVVSANNLFSNGTYTILRIESTGNKYSNYNGNYYADLYIYNNKVDLIPYHIYGLTDQTQNSAPNNTTTNYVAGNSLTDYVGTDGEYSYISYGTGVFKMRRATLNSAVYYYLDPATIAQGANAGFIKNVYTASLYDSYAYKISGDANIYDISQRDKYSGASTSYSGGGGRISADGNDVEQYSSLVATSGNLYSYTSGSDTATDYKAVSLSSLSFNLPVSGTIRDVSGNVLYGVVFARNVNGNSSATFYDNGSSVLRVEFFDKNANSENRIDTLNELYDLITNNNQTQKGESFIRSYIIGSETYSPVPVYAEDKVSSLIASVKPSNILYVRNTIHTEMFTGDFSFLGAIRVKVGLFWIGTISASDEVLTWQIDNSTFVLDYNFNSNTGIGFDCLYRPVNLNVIVLIASIVLVFRVLMQSAWGLVKRIYDITILLMIMPGFCATMPIDGGSRFKNWSGRLINSIFATYGVLIGLNIFFVLVPIIDSATANVFSYSITDYPSTIRNSFLIARPDYLNKLVGLMFTLVALTLIQTLPGIIAGLVGAGDVYADGDKVRKDAGSVLKDVGNVISGQAAIDGIGKAKNALGQLSNFIPGSAFVKQAVNAFKN
ncbi:MAG: hypothetical protein IJT25_02560, partial [Clostridia bacterium]|nr:hypothetical protein [Clostridia bacterium]